MTGIVTGTLTADASAGEPYIVTVTADDGQGGIATESFVWTINNTNPGLVSQLPNQATIDSETVTPVNVSGSFEDVDGDPLTFTAEGLPPGLTIDPTTGIITGTLPNDASAGGPYTVLITASDPQGATIVDSFVWDVENLAPEVVNPEIDLTATDTDPVMISTADNFIELDGDDLTYSVKGLPDGLSIDPVTGIISGTLGSSDSLNGPFAIEVTVTDAQGATATDVFSLTVVNPVPIAPDVSDVTVVDGQPLMVAVPFIDPDADSITYTASGLPEGLSIDPLTGLISGTPEFGQASFDPYLVTITADDGEGGISTVQFALTINSDLTNPLQSVGGLLTGGEMTFQRLSEPDRERSVGAPDGFDRSVEETVKESFAPSLLPDRGDRNFKGQVLRFGAPGYQGDLVLEGVAGDNAIYLQLTETISTEDNVKVAEWHVDSGFAEPDGLPEWISFDDANDLVVLNRTVANETAVIHIHALMEDGRVLSGDYSVDMRTGEVELVGKLINRAMLFNEQIAMNAAREAALDPVFLAAISN